jgi:GNAT superfamily N-acetyltransferase
VAEFSLTVVDAAQGQGLGKLLLAVLYAVAPARDVRVLRGVVAPENERMSTWLRRLGAALADHEVELIFDLAVSPDLSSLPDTPSGHSFRALVEQVREGIGGA